MQNKEQGQKGKKKGRKEARKERKERKTRYIWGVCVCAEIMPVISYW